MLKTHESHELRLHHSRDRATPPVIHSSSWPMDGICQLIKVRTSEGIYRLSRFRMVDRYHGGKTFPVSHAKQSPLIAELASLEDRRQL
jgi:hypothetical protein